MKIAIMGFGTVGRGAYLVAKDALNLEVGKILVRTLRDDMKEVVSGADIFTTDINDIVNDKSIELVVESIGGIDPAKEYVLACLNAGKHVVTPNKNLISACYAELMQAASDNNVELRFTPTAGGGIPWLYNLQRTKRCDKIKEIRGIVNGTCNFILDAMHDNGVEYADILAEAQKLGYAEANPAADVEGTDTLRKTVISANIAFDTIIKEEDVPCFGIDKITAADIAWFNEHGYACRLMMNAKLNADKLTAYVEPTLFPNSSLEANVKVNNNLITLVGESIGTQSFYGQGAGMLATGESVIQDVIDIKDAVELNAPVRSKGKLTVDNSAEKHRYYVRDSKGIRITEPISVSEMHAKQLEKDAFYAGIK